MSHYLVIMLLGVLCFGLFQVYVPAWSSGWPCQGITTHYGPNTESDFSQERGVTWGWLHTSAKTSGGSGSSIQGASAFKQFPTDVPPLF